MASTVWRGYITFGLISIPVSFAVFRLRGAYFAIGTWVVSEVFALAVSLIPVLGGGSGLSLTPDILHQIAADRASVGRVGSAEVDEEQSRHQTVREKSFGPALR